MLCGLMRLGKRLECGSRSSGDSGADHQAAGLWRCLPGALWQSQGSGERHSPFWEGTSLTRGARGRSQEALASTRVQDGDAELGEEVGRVVEPEWVETLPTTARDPRSEACRHTGSCWTASGAQSLEEASAQSEHTQAPPALRSRLTPAHDATGGLHRPGRLRCTHMGLGRGKEETCPGDPVLPGAHVGLGRGEKRRECPRPRAGSVEQARFSSSRGSGLQAQGDLGERRFWSQRRLGLARPKARESSSRQGAP